MNRLEEIAVLIDKKMKVKGDTKATIAVVYDSIIAIYPSLVKDDETEYCCMRKIIIESLALSYEDQKDIVQVILSNYLQVCKQYHVAY